MKPQLQIKSRKAPHPDGFRDHTSSLDSVTLHPLYFHMKDGVVQKTYSAVEDSVSLANIKKGIANILQVFMDLTNYFSKKQSKGDFYIIYCFSTQFHSQGGTVQENSPLGQCTVTYQTEHSHSSNVYKKEIFNCSSQDRAPFPFSTHSNRVLGSTHDSQIHVEVETAGDSFVVDTVTVQEKHVIRVSSKKEVGATIKGIQSLKLSGIVLKSVNCTIQRLYMFHGTNTENIDIFFTGATSSSFTQIDANSADDAVQAIGKQNGIQLQEGSLAPQNENIPFCEGSNCLKVNIEVKVNNFNIQKL